jgi:hypothetical protein
MQKHPTIGELILLPYKKLIYIVRTIHVTKKIGVQTKRTKVLVCYDFHYGISNEKEDVMFAIKSDMFSIGTIVVVTHTKHVPTLVYITNLGIVELV